MSSPFKRSQEDYDDQDLGPIEIKDDIFEKRASSYDKYLDKFSNNDGLNRGQES